ncbi:unnamed protein product, partial [Meganyctiphanes norvegica]
MPQIPSKFAENHRWSVKSENGGEFLKNIRLNALAQRAIQGSMGGRSRQTAADGIYKRTAFCQSRCQRFLGFGDYHNKLLFYLIIQEKCEILIRYNKLLSVASFVWQLKKKKKKTRIERVKIITWYIYPCAHYGPSDIGFLNKQAIYNCLHSWRISGGVHYMSYTSPECGLGWGPKCTISQPISALSAASFVYNPDNNQSTSNFLSFTLRKSSNDSSKVAMLTFTDDLSKINSIIISSDGIYRLLYEEVDESEVPIVQFIPPDDSSGMLDEFRFPRAGMANAESTLRLLEVEIGPGDELRMTTRHLRHDLKQLAPWHEYVVRVGWTPDGTQIWCQLLDRRQQRLELILLSLSSFTGQKSPATPSTVCLPHLPPHVILSQHANTWVEVHSLLYWWKTHNDSSQRMLIWASEETGHRHLYLLLVQLSPPSTNTSEHPSHEDQGLVLAQLVQKIALTRGDWSVTGGGLWVDEARGLVYFTGLRDTPLEQHLYVTSISHPGLIQRLTETGFSHQVALNHVRNNFKIIVSVKSLVLVYFIY